MIDKKMVLATILGMILCFSIAKCSGEEKDVPVAPVPVVRHYMVYYQGISKMQTCVEQFKLFPGGGLGMFVNGKEVYLVGGMIVILEVERCVPTEQEKKEML